jgi:hypothetical protein
MRIYLNRPWFATGDGELLAVIVADVPNGRTDPGDVVRPYISEMGFDPVYDDEFARRTRTNNSFTTLTAAHVVSADVQAASVKSVTPLELQGQQVLIPFTVVALGHAVQYNQDRQLWFTDVELDIGGAYAPMVRLAVARYQPNSVAGAELSKIVRIDCLQLASDRTASIVRSGTSLTVSVNGPSAPNLYGLNNAGAASASGHLVKATIDMRPTTEGELSWTPVPLGSGDMEVTLSAVAGSVIEATTWTGSIANAPTTGGGTDYRVRIEEFEQFQDDSGTATLRPVYLDTFLI